MRTKKIFISIATIIAIGIFGVTLLRAFFYIPSDEIPLPKSLMEKVETGKTEIAAKIDFSTYPTQLIIPKIKVDAEIQQVGITKKGNMATPNNFTDVGWYKYGALPGEKGSAVIAGHLDNGLSLPGVFYLLKNLDEGDDIFIKDGKGELRHFVVTQTEMYNFNDSSGNIFTENSDRFIKLITCAGSWISQYKTHNKRLVVSAVLVEK